jgi:1-acyl-sn-glycerol-3-phosphate acyltransferase
MYSLGILTNAAYETLKISIPTLVDALANRTNYQRCDDRLASWSRRLVARAGIRIETIGREHLTPNETYVVMSNHQSHYDIPVVFQALSIPIRMVAKTELFRIPVFGQAMLDSGFIELDRSNRRRAIESLKLAGKRIREDRLSIWIAPEGTRSRDGKLAEFKTGGFHLAREANVRILPVSLDGTIRVHRSGDSQVHKGETVRVTIHPPIEPAKYGREGIKELMADVRTAILSGLPEGSDATSP